MGRRQLFRTRLEFGMGYLEEFKNNTLNHKNTDYKPH